MASPPKPWERQSRPTTTSSPLTSSMPASTSTIPGIPSATTLSSAPTTLTSDTTPAIPARPASLTSAVNQTAAAYSRPYGAYTSAYSSPYASPYSRYGGYGGGMYGNYGGYGGGMYGGGMYGGGMYGAGMPGAAMPGDPNDPNSLTHRFNQGTQATFQMLEGIVGAFGGFAQMLESTYMATHSSFFAMVAVAEQFGNLRDALGSVLGIFALMRWLRSLLARLTGRPLPADATVLTPAAFARFEGRQQPPGVPDGHGAPAHAKPSRKPLLFFLLAAFGLPYVMSKLIRSLAASHEEEERRRAAQLALAQQQAVLDPSKLEFCRVLYDFSPATAAAQQQQQQQNGGGEMVPGVDLEVHRGDLVAVLGKTDPLGNPSDWWRCRARDGRVGYLPCTFLEVLQRSNTGGSKPLPALDNRPAGGDDASRADSLTSRTGRAHTITSEVPVPVPVPESAAPAVPTKVGDVSAESFQKAQFYS